jgi:hypothetical protein
MYILAVIFLPVMFDGTGGEMAAKLESVVIKLPLTFRECVPKNDLSVELTAPVTPDVTGAQDIDVPSSKLYTVLSAAGVVLGALGLLLFLQDAAADANITAIKRMENTLFIFTSGLT